MNGDGLRRRAPKARPALNSYASEDDSTGDNGSATLGWAQWIFLTIYVVGVIFGSQYIAGQLPKPWPSSEHGDTRDLTRFSEDRALQHLLVLTSFRPRSVGTDGNDKFAVRYFIKEAEAIKKKSLSVNEIEIDHQVVSGSFRLAFLNGTDNFTAFQCTVDSHTSHTGYYISTHFLEYFLLEFVCPGSSAVSRKAESFD